MKRMKLVPFRLGEPVRVRNQIGRVFKLCPGGAIKVETPDGRAWLLSGFCIGEKGEPCYEVPS